MTMIIAIIARDGIACVADGMVTDHDSHKAAGTEAVKIYELSPLTIMMMSGMGGDTVELLNSGLNKIFIKKGEKGVDEINRDLFNAFKAGLAVDKWDGQPFDQIIAGYTDPKDSSPPVARLYKQSIDENGKLDNYLVTESQPYVVSGKGSQGVYEFLDNEVPNIVAKLGQFNQLALRAMLLAQRTHPEYVGGAVRLFNIVPGKPIRKVIYKIVKR